MRFAADAIAGSIAELTGNYQIKADRLNKNLAEIQKELESGDEYTVEEENTLRQQTLQYRNQLDNLASRGLVSSTLRTETDFEKARLQESTTRQFARNRQQADRRARDYARQLEQRFGTEGAQRILQGSDPVLDLETGKPRTIEGAQNVQGSGLSSFFLGDVSGVEARNRAAGVFNFALAKEPLDPLLNPLAIPKTTT